MLIGSVLTSCASVLIGKIAESLSEKGAHIRQILLHSQGDDVDDDQEREPAD
jgi:hypothetical protein